MYVCYWYKFIVYSTGFHKHIFIHIGYVFHHFLFILTLGPYILVSSLISVFMTNMTKQLYVFKGNKIYRFCLSVAYFA